MALADTHCTGCRRRIRCRILRLCASATGNYRRTMRKGETRIHRCATRSVVNLAKLICDRISTGLTSNACRRSSDSLQWSEESYQVYVASFVYHLKLGSNCFSCYDRISLIFKSQRARVKFGYAIVESCIIILCEA